MKPDQERVKALLTDTVTLLCKNGLQFDKELRVQGLLGITTDENDVFVVHINEKFGDLIATSSDNKTDTTQTESAKSNESLRARRKRSSEEETGSSVSKRKHMTHSDKDRVNLPLNTDSYEESAVPDIKVKIEEEDDDVLFTGSTDDFSLQPQTFGATGFHKPKSRVSHTGDVYPAGGAFITGPHSSHTSSLGDNSGSVGGDEQFILESLPGPSDSVWDQHQIARGADASEQGIGDSSDLVETVVQKIPPEILDPLPFSHQDLFTVTMETQALPGFGHGRAGFLINKLLNMSFTREEFATSRGLGRFLNHAPCLDPARVQAVKDVLEYMCQQFGWQPLTASLINHKFSQKCVHARYTNRSRSRKKTAANISEPQ